MEETDRVTTRPAPSRDRVGKGSVRSPFARWGMLLAVLGIGAVILFAAPQSGGAWATSGTGLILLLLLPCLLMLFMMGGGHGGTSERNNSDDKGP